MKTENLVESEKKTKKKSDDEIWYAREYWSGDSKDGIYTNGDGYHYFEMKGRGSILKAFEYYETDEGEEHVTVLNEFVGMNWFDTFGYQEDEDEVLETIPEHEFNYVEGLVKQ